MRNGRRLRAERAAASSWRAIAHNRNIRNVELGWTLSVGIDWLVLVVALVLAYDVGGPALAGLVPLFRMGPATLVSVVLDTGRFARPERFTKEVCAAGGTGGERPGPRGTPISDLPREPQGPTACL